MDDREAQYARKVIESYVTERDRARAAADALAAALQETMTQLRRWRDEKPETWDTIIDSGMMNAWDANKAALKLWQ